MIVRHERELYSPMIKGAQAEGWPLWRLEDGAFGLNPFDLVGSDPLGKAVGCEVKLLDKLRNGAAVPWSLFKSHQKRWLDEYSKRGAVALIALADKSGEVLLKELLAGEVGAGIVIDHEHWYPLHFVYDNSVLCGWNRLIFARAARQSSP